MLLFISEKYGIYCYLIESCPGVMSMSSSYSIICSSIFIDLKWLPITQDLPPSRESDKDVIQRKAIAISLNSDRFQGNIAMKLRILQTVQCTSLRVGKSLFKLISEPAQVKRKGV